MKINKKILFAHWAAENEKYYSYQTWHHPLKKIFSKVITFDPQKQLLFNTKDKMNYNFLELIKKEKPDHVFLWLISDEFYIETLLKIKEISPGTKIINYCCDDDSLFDYYSYYYSLFIDYFLVTHKEYLKQYINKAFLFLSIDTETFKPLNVEKIYDVTFVGTPKIDRPEFIKYLMEKGINLKVFGQGWENFPEFKKVYGGVPGSEEYNKIINQSKINLCFTKNPHRDKHINQRPFEIAASKSFFIMEYSPGYLDFFKKGEELIMFKTKEELLERISYYLKNKKERIEIANNAYHKVLKNYSMDKNLYNFFKKIEKDKLAKTKRDLFFSKAQRVYNLDINDLSFSNRELENILKDYDYVIFKDKNSKSMNFREQLQSHSIGYTSKPISCCNYYIKSNSLGNYFLFRVNLAYKTLNREDFIKFINLSQLVVEKKYFLENKEKFHRFSNEDKIQLINEKNTAFISIPLIEIKKAKIAYLKNIEEFSGILFVEELLRLHNNKQLLLSLYPLKMFIYSLFNEPFILQYMIKKLWKRY